MLIVSKHLFYIHPLTNKMSTQVISCESSIRECAICMGPIDTKNSCVTPCGHTFCFSDLITWLKQNNGCPCCREQLVEDDTPSEEEDDDSFIDDDEEDDDDHSLSSSDDDAIDLDKLTKQFEDAGYTLKDALAVMLGNHKSYKTDDAKYTLQHHRTIENKLDEILSEMVHREVDNPEEEPARDPENEDTDTVSADKYETAIEDMEHDEPAAEEESMDTKAPAIETDEPLENTVYDDVPEVKRRSREYTIIEYEADLYDWKTNRTRR